jgi:2,5-dihydroxypyridine 5,6-dioxygenase
MSFTELCRRELELCEVNEETVVAVLSQGSGDQPMYAQSFMAAAQQLGASCYTVTLAPPELADLRGLSAGVSALSGNRAAVEALKQADLVVDLIFLLFSPEQEEILASGTRILLAIEPPDNLARMFPSPDLRRRVEHGEHLIAEASTLRFTNTAGTDVTYQIGDMGILTEYGYTATPGRWDHWPSGFVATAPNEHGVDGRVVIAPGDILFPFKRYAREATELVIEKGRVTDVRGDLEADLLRDYMEGFADPDAYGISHIGWGLNEHARWSGLLTDTRSIGMEARSFYGNVLFSTGPNAELGGTNRTACHLDIPMRGCSLYLDERPIVIDGDVVVDEMKAPS